ncbi:MAG: type I glutamate--ammonia ligase [Alphaproteobacteria bacterium]|nr:type I glutamate--ammonia ligase [Alphaproteobacteria bacterium]MCL2505732.1 type I glutamate--ammonia ligase [Alphaproteobacteria bacterium]
MPASKNKYDSKNLREIMEENNTDYVDLRFTDPRGKLQHVTQHIDTIDNIGIEDRVMFDASSISGWKHVNESDMILMPDVSTCTLDPFYAKPTLVVLCDVYDAVTEKPYSRCPRSIAKKAEAYLKSSGIGDDAFFASEVEFFIFDKVRFSTTSTNSFFFLDSKESPSSSGIDYVEGNMGHRPRTKGGYFPVNPIDSAQDLRTEMLTVAKQLGICVEKHHHEAAVAQHELGIKYDTMLRSADNTQQLKYIIHNLCDAYGKTATFMPKPLFDDNGSGMHVHQSIWKAGKPLFAGDVYSGLSETALHYIGGIMKHTPALNAITNPSINSYKRLVPGYEAPVLLAYSARNRSAALRIPYAKSPRAKRVEVRFPDPLANPYLAFAAMMMAGLDGIENKIDPGEPSHSNLYELSAEEQRKIPTVCSSLNEAIRALIADSEFLLKGDVFTKDFLDSYIELLRADWDRYKKIPHPVEFDMYYSG